MKANPKYAFVAMVAVVGMTACGGSADDGAGQLSEFQVSPDSVEIQSGTTACPLFKTGEYTIVGGTPPYVVYSPYDPDPLDPTSLGVTFSAPGGNAPTHRGTYTVSNRNERFAVYVQGCFDPATVTILDNLRRDPVTIEISYAASGAN